MPLPRQGPAAAVGPMLVAPSLPEVTYPHPPRRWTLWHLLLVLIVLSALAAVVVRMTHRPTVLYTATSAAVDRVKALLPR
jgi:cell division protein FtsL